MLSAQAIRRWTTIHRWTSLVCGLFLLVLCVTGLPLIFHDELDRAFGYSISAVEYGTNPPPSIDEIVSGVLERHPSLHVQFILWDRDTPGVVAFALGQAIDSPPDRNLAVYVDASNGRILSEGSLHRGPVGVLLKLHSELFLGPMGPIVVGAVAVLFLVALISGVIVYAPLTRRISFGMLRKAPRRIRWLDLHNLVGMVTLGWALVVGATGLINTWGDLAVQIWQARELSSMSHRATVSDLHSQISVHDAIAAAESVVPGMTPLFVAMPGSVLTSRSHLGVFLRGDRPLTQYLLKPVLIDAGTGTVAASRGLPWYMQALFLAQPLHFGDYGGLLLKVLWAMFDIATIFVLMSGLYLWWIRWRKDAGRVREVLS